MSKHLSQHESWALYWGKEALGAVLGNPNPYSIQTIPVSLDEDGEQIILYGNFFERPFRIVVVLVMTTHGGINDRNGINAHRTYEVASITVTWNNVEHEFWGPALAGLGYPMDCRIAA